MMEWNPNGSFDALWWKPFLKELNKWKATRGKGKTNAYLTARAHDRFGALSQAWDVDWAKSLDKDISSTPWA